jgi:transposase
VDVKFAILAISILREIIRLLFMNLAMSNRQLARIVGSSHQSINRVKIKVGALTYTYDEYLEMDDNELIRVLYPKMELRVTSKRRPDFDEISKQLNVKPRKYGKKRKLMFLEYQKQDPATALGQTQFYKLANRHHKLSKLEMKQEYYPGEYLCIDYVGMTISFKDKGKNRVLYVFVACLPFSRKMFAFATPSMKAVDWINGLTQAVNYYGRVALVIHFDNAKAMVRKAGLIADISDKAIDFAQYHDCLCDTSRVGTPTDNPHGEKSVQFIENRVLVVMRSMTFFSIDEVNRYLLKEVEKLNDELMQEYKVSRNELFKTEFSELIELPAMPYEPIIKHSSVKHQANYLVKYDGCEYSFPFQFHKEIIEYKATQRHIRFYCKGKLITEHELAKNGETLIRLEEHMPENHRAQFRKTKVHFMKWAKEIGVSAVKVIEAQYSAHKYVKSQYAGKRCVAIQKIANKHTKQEFEGICQYAIEYEMFTPSDIQLIAQTNIYDQCEVIEPHIIEHTNIRGSQHYTGRA